MKEKESPALEFARGRPGRPKGSITTGDPVGAKRAREWSELHHVGQVSSLSAAQQVADKWGVSPSDIYRDIRRHEPRLVKEIHSEIEELQRNLERLRFEQGNKKRAPPGVASCISAFLDGLNEKKPDAN